MLRRSGPDRLLGIREVRPPAVCFVTLFALLVTINLNTPMDK